MTSIKRRHFLQLAGSTMAALGLDQANFFRQSEQYGRVLAQPTGRKVALLVGVNQYPGRISDLRGCISDVEMQKQLLLHRYGFKASDIHVLTDTTIKPTRANILGAFQEYLIDAVKPGDVAVFHFSGHGSRVIDSTPLSNATKDRKGNALNGTLLPVDARSNARGAGVNDIMGKTLFLLSKQVQTDQFTMVLDSCHSGGGTRGNVLVRNVEPRLGESEAVPSQIELALQETLREKLGLSQADLQQEREASIARGLALGSARANQYATDAVFDGFYAGAFSYLLTQYLWQLPSSEPIERSFNQLALITRDVANTSGIVQDPIYEAQQERYRQKPIYFMDAPRPAAEAVIREIDGNNVKYWMGGVSSRSLKSYGPASVFNLVDDQGKKIGEIEQTGRTGLMGEGKLRSGAGQAAVGGFMQEKIRGVPTNLQLTVGLDPSLGNLVSAIRTQINAVKRVNSVVIDPDNLTEEVDYIVGRLTPDAQQQGRDRNINLQTSPNTVGILSSNLTPVPDSFGGSAEESVDSIMSRLEPRLKSLLASKLLTSVVNSNMSELKVNVSVEQAGANQGTISAQRSGGDRQSFIPQTIAEINNQVQAGDEIQVTVENNEARNLYIAVISISSTGDLAILHPVDYDSPDAASLVQAGRSITVPDRGLNQAPFVVYGPAGFFELMVVASTEPLRNALKGLQQIAMRSIERGALSEGDFLVIENEEQDTLVESMESLLGDLNDTRAGVSNRRRSLIPTSRLAGFSSIIEVVDNAL